jgi:hypothetical protein
MDVLCLHVNHYEYYIIFYGDSLTIMYTLCTEYHNAQIMRIQMHIEFKMHTFLSFAHSHTFMPL